MFNLFKKKKSQQEEAPQQMECPLCGGKMMLQSGLSYTFHCRGQEVEMSDITAMKCADCGEMIFDWPEAQRIEKYVHAAVSWEDMQK